MEKEVLVKVEGVSKKFCKNLKTSLWYGFKDLFSSLTNNKVSSTLRPQEFWALKDTSFELRRGECLGLIGHNGAGKSTLLKILNGLINPDQGTVTITGRVGAIIELGAGFNPILTGRENIYNNGAILGFSKKEINDKIDEIIDFAEVREFIDMPVQNYSSGMKVRLGFSIAAQMEPDVLLIDEVLTVGDAGFKAKSFNKLSQLIQKCAVIFVSHSMPAVSRICNRILFLKNGVKGYEGASVHQAINLYYETFKGEEANIEYMEGAEIASFLLNHTISSMDQLVEIRYLGSLTIELNILIKKDIKEFFVSVQITDKDLKIVGQFFSNKFYQNFVAKKENSVKIVFPNLQFIDGEYNLTYFIIESLGDNYNILATYRNYNKFKMMGLNAVFYSSIYLTGKVYQGNLELSESQRAN